MNIIVVNSGKDYLDNNNMSGTQTWILRVSIVLGMVAAVVTVLYFTPMPEHHFKSCDRPCHELDWPMICRIKLNLEIYHTLGRSCEDCPINATQCGNKHCIVADGNARNLLTVNRKLPGPPIQVCQNDIVVVDVTNKVPGQDFTIHWRGQQMQSTPCMDGVPMVTQCPITSYTTFQYKFRATVPGTHTWHAHSTSHTADGLFGALIVRQSELLNPQKRLYDIDHNDYTLLISEWNRKSLYNKKNFKPSLLINGKGNVDGYIPTYTVKAGLRYRFRVAYASGTNNCPVELSIDQHHLKVIALDGHPTVPYEATSVILGRGERLDFVLKANQNIDSYVLQIISNCEDSVSSIIGNLVYENIESNEITNSLEESELSTRNDNSRVFLTDGCNSQLGKICVNDVQSLFVMPSSLRSEKVDNKLYMVFDHLIIEKQDSGISLPRVPRVNNITFTFPSSPLLSQADNVPANVICNSDHRPDRCLGQDTCECVHVEQLPYGNSVEIILIHAGNDEENIFHLHGYSFYVVGIRQFSKPVPLEEIKKLDSEGQLLKRNLKSPAYKDTIRISKYSVVAIRFVADNPGYWLLRDEHAQHWSSGKDVILQVGSKRDFQTIPYDFPRCGSWIGPEFFLV